MYFNHRDTFFGKLIQQPLTAFQSGDRIRSPGLSASWAMVRSLIISDAERVINEFAA